VVQINPNGELPDLNDYRYFAVVVDCGGFSAAARQLGLPKSRLSRRVAGLESRLGVRLLQRSTRRITVTHVGQQVLAHCQALLREAEAAECAAARVKAEPSGRVRVSLPMNLLDISLIGVFEKFMQDHPKVTLDVIQTSRRVDLIEEGVDLALRVRAADDEDPQWATRRLTPTRPLLVASPALAQAHGGLITFAQLEGAPVMGATAPDGKVHWRLEGPDDEVKEVALAPRLSSDHFALRTRAAVLGLGVTMLPEVFALPEIETGRLVQVLPGWRFQLNHLQAVYVSQRGLSPAVRALLDALAQVEAPGI
jgi:DNA-binding transcriptional LysR family regulator